MSQQEFLDNLQVNSNYKETVLVTACAIKDGTNGNYLIGSLMTTDKCTVPYKVWNSSKDAYECMCDGSIAGKVCEIVGTVKEYNGKYIDIKSCTIVEDADIEPYLEIRYEKEKYEKAFWQIIEQNVSENGKEVLEKILRSDESVYERFTKEFAAKTFHDNCLFGLLGHTTKCLTILQFYLKVYPQLYKYKGEENEQYLKDLLFIGMALHDIGKIQEMYYGVYQHRSIVTHRIIGLEMVFPYKDLIVEKYGEDWYDFLLSIIAQHHTGYNAEEAKTMPAMIVHLIDNLDSLSTNLVDQLRTDIKKNECGDTIYYKTPQTIIQPNPYFNVF